MYDAERGKEPWWVQGGAGDQRACVRLCACLCLPVPVACRRVFDARHNFTERVPAGFQIPSGIFNVYLSYSSILTRISGLGCGLFHPGRAARNRVSRASICFLPCWARGSFVPPSASSRFLVSSMGPCSLHVYKVIAAHVFLCSLFALLACCFARLVLLHCSLLPVLPLFVRARRYCFQDIPCLLSRSPRLPFTPVDALCCFFASLVCADACDSSSIPRMHAFSLSPPLRSS